MSTIDAEKYKQLVEIFNPAAVFETTGTATESDGATSPNEDITVEEIVDLKTCINTWASIPKKNGLDDAVSIENDSTVAIKFMSSIFFEPDSSWLKPGDNKYW